MHLFLVILSIITKKKKKNIVPHLKIGKQREGGGGVGGEREKLNEFLN